MMIEKGNNSGKGATNLSCMIEKFSHSLSRLCSMLREFTGWALYRVQLRLLNAMNGLLFFALLNGVVTKGL